MTRIAYVNGQYVPQRHAVVSMEDRAHQLSDGVYEYLSFYDHHLIHPHRHLARLERSLQELRIPMPMQAKSLLVVMNELIARNLRTNGGLYMQVSRGVSRRDHGFPAAKLKPTLTLCVGPSKLPSEKEYKQGVSVITMKDLRWGRRDIKTVSLLGNVLAKQAANEAKVREAWLVQPDGTISEGSTSNAFIVDANGTLITHPANERILSGVTREFVLELAQKNGLRAEERPFTVDEAKQAAEAFITSTSVKVLPVVKIDDVAIGSGAPGPITKKLISLYAAFLKTEAGRDILPV